MLTLRGLWPVLRLIQVRVAQGGMDDRQGPTPGQLLVDSVDGFYNGRYKTSAPSDDGYLIYW